MENEYSAADALRHASSSRQHLAQRLTAPTGFHGARAAMIALCVGSFGVNYERHLELRLGLCVAGVAAIIAVYRWYSHATGASVREGAGGWWRFGFLLALFLGVNVERYLAVDADRWALVVAVGALTSIACWALAVREDEVVRQRVASGEKVAPQP